jgi:halocyanin-like protein
MTDIDIDRRKVLMASGATMFAAIAGCSGGGDSDDGGDGGDDGGDGGDDGGNGGNVPSAVSDHLSEANGFDGSVEDMTGQDSVTIENGAGSADSYEFSPAAIRIDSGTEVTWEWVSAGHTVTVVEGDADIDTAIESEGFTKSYTFENSGNVLYECTPHAGLGQLGAVIVE